MRHIEIEDTIIDVDDITMLRKSINKYDGINSIYELNILFKYQNRHTQEIRFKTQDDMEKAYKRIKKLLVISEN